MKINIPDVWVVWPTIHLEKTQEMIRTWHGFGYKVAILANPPFVVDHFEEAELVLIQKKWKGFPTAVNLLCKAVPGNIVVVVGDDVYPDPYNTAQKIGKEFLKRFPDTFGVMQPTGDEFGCYDTCAVSPWIGKAFIEKAYNGKGPYWKKYFHYFCDEELQEYATQLNVFQQRKDLIQYHDHWQRAKNPTRPIHLLGAKGKWCVDKKIFETRKKKGFPNGTN